MADQNEIVVVYTMRYDRAKADAQNASLFGGDEADPVQGDGTSLVKDVLEGFFSYGDCGVMPVGEAFVGAEMKVDDAEPVEIKPKYRTFAEAMGRG